MFDRREITILRYNYVIPKVKVENHPHPQSHNSETSSTSKCLSPQFMTWDMQITLLRVHLPNHSNNSQSTEASPATSSTLERGRRQWTGTAMRNNCINWWYFISLRKPVSPIFHIWIRWVQILSCIFPCQQRRRAGFTLVRKQRTGEPLHLWQGVTEWVQENLVFVHGPWLKSAGQLTLFPFCHTTRTHTEKSSEGKKTKPYQKLANKLEVEWMDRQRNSQGINNAHPIRKVLLAELASHRVWVELGWGWAGLFWLVCGRERKGWIWVDSGHKQNNFRS